MCFFQVHISYINQGAVRIKGLIIYIKNVFILNPLCGRLKNTKILKGLIFQHKTKKIL